ncbi:hypothetical protein EJ03DRAFT_372631 [Teratosphaeria nubilosa]|uniref:HMG box domain-containing protein n=1 Tax=Teratosphaeria nubilosa TaxID=161662 RepID=A0A6G1LFE9_9PEZI|nr:hypothetical protein EJ03DRAFT_372631 [Teratosphaeria nubilosa]
MIGRQVAVVFRHARLSCPATTVHHGLPRRPLTAPPHRFYATPGRPKSVVGEPSRPVKRSVKKAAPKATASGSPAKDKVELKKKQATAKKPAAKKKPAKEKPTEEQAAQRAAKAERKAAKTKADELRALKKLALQPPAISRPNAWVLFMAEKTKEALKGHRGNDVKVKLAQTARDAAAQFRAMSPAEIERYNHLAHTAREESQVAFKKWVESHTPDEIAEANRARKALRRKAEVQRKKGHKIVWVEIEDERAVKGPMTPYAAFNANRQKSPDFNNISFVDRSRLVAQEWKAMSQEEKNKYQLLRDQDMKRYVAEYSSTYGHPPPSLQQPQAAATATAAA